eukprot:TRINITY_DN1373_c0_g1_i6.p1 TRINITY_DN1373_c0_g1~~TRINITY_DN1373_c0_g1_i6.p1  ORF type:complete len:968 (-),score=107.74 TRINITY_DN1373_c0_g1_i6:542-3445(-)
MEQNLPELLRGCLSSSPETRNAAEQQIIVLRRSQGFGPTLLQVLQQQNLDQGARLLAGILLKQYITEQWCLDYEEYGSLSQSFGYPQISDNDKVLIRQNLLQLIADPCSKLTNNIAVAVSQIAHFDCPDQWPDLIPTLLAGVKQKENIHVLRGCVQCLNEMSAEIGEDQLVPVFQELEQELYSIVQDSSQNSLKEVVVLCLKIFGGWLETLVMMKGVYQEQVQQSVVSILPKWLNTVCQRITQTPQSDGDWSLQEACLNVIQSCVRGFAASVSELLPKIVELCVNLVGHLSEKYHSDPEAALNIILKSLETVVTFSEISSCSSLLNPWTRHLVFACLQACPTIDEDLLEFNQFIELDAEEQSKLRSTCALLLSNLYSNRTQEFIPTFQTEIVSAMQRNQSWQAHEVFLYLVGYVYMQEELNEQQIQLITMLLQVLQESQVQQAHPCVVARALWVSMALFSFLPANLQELALHSSVKELEKGSNPVVNLTACRTLVKVLTVKKSECGNFDFSCVFSNVFALLESAPNAQIPMILKCLWLMVSVCRASIAKFGPDYFLGSVAQIWEANIGDVLIEEEVHGIIKAMSLSGMDSSVKQLLPALCGVVQGNQGEHHKQSAMNLLVSIVKYTTQDISKLVLESLHEVLLSEHFIKNADDDLVNSEVVLLCHVIGKLQAGLVNIQVPDVYQKFINVTSILLNTDIPAQKCRGVGILIFLLLRYMKDKTMVYAQDIIRAIVQKLGCMQSNILLNEELLAIICRLLILDFQGTLNVLNTVSPDATSMVFKMISDSTLDCSTQLHLKLFTMTLLQALSIDRQIVDNIKVNCSSIDISSNVQTRSQANKTGNNFEVVPLSVGATVALIRIYAQMTEDSYLCIEESEDEDDSNGGLDSKLGPKMLIRSEVKNSGQVDELLDVSAFDSSIEQDTIYQVDLVRCLADFFGQCVQQQSEHFKYALLKCSQKQRELIMAGPEQ